MAAVEQLAGDYDVVLVDVANGYPPRLAYRIHLYVTDSARRFRSAQPYGPRHLTGWVVTNDTTLRTRYMRSQDPDRPGIVWRGAQTLSIGDNVSTLDGWGADLLGVTWHTETGFGGTWHFADPGVELVVRTDGKPYRNPSGYFCAHRVAAGA